MEKGEVDKHMAYSPDNDPPRWYVTDENKQQNDEPGPSSAEAIIDDESREKSTDEYVFNDIIPAKKIMDWKDTHPVTIINEYCQITKRDWSFRIESVGPSNSPTFYARVDIDGILFDKADGSSKRDAKNKAAKLAVDKLLTYVIIRF
ncbi:dsRNA-binding protein [Volepox virus]|uniref:DsRNA-binding protein n=1 Tax=Volepox virus TaxID=28874 RepID=A0A1C9KC59_9POXV|nr:dsRNA-binding protein [Volepox virus]AOP31747.1 dsRNA-binding protein [Volepox virus]